MGFSASSGDDGMIGAFVLCNDQHWPSFLLSTSSSVQFGHLVVSGSFGPHGLQHAVYREFLVH